MSRVDFAQVRRNVDLVAYFASKGHDIKKVGSVHRINPCPICGHNDSFTVDVVKGLWRCFSSAHPEPSHGDAVEFEMQTEHVSMQEAVERVCKGNVPSNVVPIESRDDSDPQRPKLWSVQANHEALLKSPKLLAWLTEERCLSLDVITAMKIGVWKPQGKEAVYSFPYFGADGSLLTVKYRSASKERIWFQKGAEIPLYNIGALGDAKAVLIVEGELDCLAALTYGLPIPVLSVPTGAGTRFRDEWMGSLARLSRIYLLYDADEAGRAGAAAAAETLGPQRCYLVGLPEGMKDLNEALIAGFPKEQIADLIRRAMPCDPIIQAIDAIPRNDAFAASRVRDEIVPMLAQLDDDARLEDMLSRAKQRLRLSLKQQKAIRGELERLRAPDEDVADEEDPPMSAEDEAEAMELLRNPRLLAVIESDLTDALGIQGEQHVKMALYLTMMSRITDHPICATVLAASSEGKSYVVEQVSRAFDSRAIIRLTSSSTRALECAGSSNEGPGMLDGVVIIIGEWDALADPILESIVRQAMSEQRVSRLSTQWRDSAPLVTLNESSIRAAWVVTSTTETAEFNIENLNRGWTLYVSSDPAQTRRVLEFQKKTQTLAWKKGAAEREQRINRLQNANRLLKNYEVVIPFAELVSFPANTARARRDLSRFFQTVKLVTLLYQHQRDIKTDDGLEYLESSVDDFEAAFDIMAPVIAGTLSDLSERCKRALRVAVHLRDADVASGRSADNVDFSVRELQAHAESMASPVDIRNSQDLRRQLRVLTKQEYLCITDGAGQHGGGKAKRYAIASKSIALDENGELTGLADALLGITTPAELRTALGVRDV